MLSTDTVEAGFAWSEDDWDPRVLHQLVPEASERWGADKVLFDYVDEGVRLTVGGLGAAARTWARALVSAGVEPGDRVAVALPGSSLWPVLQVACSEVGAVICGINTRYGSHELGTVLGNAEPRVVVTSGSQPGWPFGERLAPVLAALPAPPVTVRVDGAEPDGADWLTVEAFLDRASAPDAQLAERRAAVRPEHTAMIQYTSGSTGTPKGVELSHDAFLLVANGMAHVAGYEDNDIVYSALPFYHIGGSICTGISPLICGARMVIPRLFDAARSIEQMIELDCTATQGHTAMFTMQIEAARAAGTLDRLTLRKGWIAAPPRVMRLIVDELGIDGLVPVYGMSEYGLICAGSLDEPVDERISATGRPAPGSEVRLRGADGGRGPGEVEVRGRQRMTAYRGDPEATRAALDDDGWLRTGDIGEWDEAGRLHFVGREKEMIKPGGENVAALEVEEFLAAHPAIEGVVVIGVRDPRLGEAPAAVVALVPGAELDLEEVRRFCADRLARFKVPKALFVEASLPMLANGKIDRAALAGRYGDHLVEGA
jgi:acyl-CoA synthetase (AMP-forming)/AMP-acid ligase II